MTKQEHEHASFSLRCLITIISGAVLLTIVLFLLAGVTFKSWPPLQWLAGVSSLILLLNFLPAIIRKIRKHSELTEPTAASLESTFTSFTPHETSLEQEIQIIENPCSNEERKSGFELARQVFLSILRERKR